MLHFDSELILMVRSKSENDDSKREMESIKPPSAVSIPSVAFSVISSTDQKQPGSHTGGFSENFAASLQLARSGSSQRFDHLALQWYT